MKVLCISDHAPRVDILKVIQDYNPEIIFTLGDLELFPLRMLENTNILKLGVYGNHCYKGENSYFKTLNIWDMHMKVVEFKSKIIFGFEGSNKYKEATDRAMFTQDEAMSLMEKVVRPADIVISHSPPFGIQDEPTDPTHQGLKALNYYCQKFKPKFLFHGHTYPTEHQTMFDQTLVQYVDGLQVFDIDFENQKIVQIFSDR